MFEQEGIDNGGSWAALESYGGAKGVAASLSTSLTDGILDESSLPIRVELYGDNTPPKPPQASFLMLMWNALDDTSLRILIFAAMVSLIGGLYNDLHHGWVEGVAIIAAVLIVLFITSTNDYIKDKQFRKFSAKTEETMCTVIRGGNQREMAVSSLLVGDVILLNPGMIVPADGLVSEGYSLRVEEVSITGEQEVVKKDEFSADDSSLNPFLLCGSKVEEGVGKMLVCAVGRHSNIGRDTVSIVSQSSRTPLQNRLEAIADSVGKIGFYAALLILLALVAHLLIASVKEDWTQQSTAKLIDSFIVSVTILVVAVPEGLPLAIVLSLAYSLEKMKKEKNVVRRLHACETMGSVTDICTDKTGILTKNHMNVAAWYLLGHPDTQISEEVSDTALARLLAENFALNSDASLITMSSQIEHRGDRTECAFLELCNKWHTPGYESIRRGAQILTRIPFSSKLKYMCTVALQNHDTYVYVKGAPEVVLPMCEFQYESQGGEAPLDAQSKERLERDIIANFAKDGLRPMAVAYKLSTAGSFGTTSEPKVEYLTSRLILLGVFGVSDPVRPEIPKAVEAMQKGGINVRMVTGDNLKTAIAVAQKCGILGSIYSLRADSSAAMDGADFEKAVGEMREVTIPDGSKVFKIMDMYRFTAVVNELKVLARCSPRQKFMLVTGLREMENKVVAVTGKGANDVASLRRADVGMAANLSGTQLAKNCADIVLLDDNFASIITTLKWGRNVYDSVRKFVQFQLTVNIVTLVVCCVSALAAGKLPFTAVQLLWINLVMDTFAALALATESPSDDVLLRRPAKRTDLLIDDTMKKTIGCAALFQLLVLAVLLLWGADLFGIKSSYISTDSTHFTLVFSAFMYMQLGNEVNCRKLKSTDRNLFKGICRNMLFLLVVLGTLAVQIVLVEFGG